MTSPRFAFLAILLMGSASLAHADGIPVDPQMDVSDPFCPSESGSGCPTNVNEGQGFMFTVGPNGGGIFMGTNEDSQWNSLLFTFPSLPPTMVISCTSSGTGDNPAPFASPCTQQEDPFNDGLTDLIYTTSGESCGIESFCPGIPVGEIFTINLNDTGLSTGSWPVGTTFTAFPNQVRSLTSFVTLTSASVPEPGTITLLGAGLVALVAKRRFRRQLQARS
jgi:PEP-CTERM motif